MPDLTTEYRSVCPTVHNFVTWVTGKDSKYLVTYGPTPTGEYAHGWTCTCLAFRYRKDRGKECKHIKQAKAERCAWNEEAYCGGGEPRPADGKCPKCGAELETIQIAV